MSLELLFKPRSLLFISDTKKRENFLFSPEICENIRMNLKEFSGRVFFSEVLETNDKNFPEVDLVVLATLPNESLSIIPHLKTKFLIILSGGFDEEQRKTLKTFVSSFRILGPNSVCGIINTENSLNTTFEKNLELKKGKISVVSQSGGVGAALLDHAISQNIGISKFIWIGDAIDINECEILRYLIKDKNTKVILLYLETIKKPREFMEIAKKSHKPIIVLKGAASEEAKERALTHTDSLSTSSELYTAAFKQSRVIEVETIRELFACGLLFERYKKRKIKKVAIVSNTGGSSILAADLCAKLGLELAKFTEKTKGKISEKCTFIKVVNPLDILADADGKRYKEILDIVVRDKETNAILIIAQLKSCAIKPEELETLKRLKTGKIVVACVPGEEDYKKVKFFLRDTFPIYSEIDDAVKVLKKAEEYGKG
jgi:acetyltransferase